MEAALLVELLYFVRYKVLLIQHVIFVIMALFQIKEDFVSLICKRLQAMLYLDCKKTIVAHYSVKNAILINDSAKYVEKDLLKLQIINVDLGLVLCFAKNATRLEMNVLHALINLIITRMEIAPQCSIHRTLAIIVV